MVIKAVIFDFDGVISHDNTLDVLNNFSSSFNSIALYHRMLSSREFYDCMLGKIPFIDLKRKIADIADTDEETAEKMIDRMISSREPDETVLNIARRLKGSGYTLVLHSDMMKVPFDAWVRKFKLKEIFDHVLCSAYIGTLKNNPETYDKIKDYLSLDFDNILYIDDNKANIYTLQHKGVTGILFKNSETLMKDLGEMHLLNY